MIYCNKPLQLEQNCLFYPKAMKSAWTLAGWALHFPPPPPGPLRPPCSVLKWAACQFLCPASSAVLGTPRPSSRCQPSCPAKGAECGATKGSKRPASMVTILNILGQCGRSFNLPAALGCLPVGSFFFATVTPTPDGFEASFCFLTQTRH